MEIYKGYRIELNAENNFCVYDETVCMDDSARSLQDAKDQIDDLVREVEYESLKETFEDYLNNKIEPNYQRLLFQLEEFHKNEQSV